MKYNTVKTNEDNGMTDHTEMLCELWNEERVEIKPHSRLYPLKPLGVGSPMVESLTSYITRLAAEHSVSICTLVKDEIAPLWQNTQAYQHGYLDSHYLKTYLSHSDTLNGITIKANDMVQVIEHLTGCHNLMPLTMLNWKPVLSHEELLKHKKSWCPACYEEWKRNGQTIYDPLLWFIADINVCHKHSLSLETQCPYPNCNRLQSPLAPYAQPGYCSYCRHWLGGTHQYKVQNVQQLDSSILEWQEKAILTVGEMLSSTFSLSPLPQRETFLAAIVKYADMLTDGNLKALSDAIQYNRRLIRYWLYEGGKPQLKNLLNFCFQLGATPLCLLRGEIEEVRALKYTFEQKPNNLPRKINKEELRMELEAILQSKEYPPPSMAEVGRRLEFDPSQLRRLFPIFVKPFQPDIKPAQFML